VVHFFLWLRLSSSPFLFSSLFIFGFWKVVSLLLHFSSPLGLYLAFGRDFIVLVVVLKGMYSFFFIFVFFYFNYDYFFLVFFVLCIVCR
jgi:hypothetical protein